jgi:hypothetical protein
MERNIETTPQEKKTTGIMKDSTLFPHKKKKELPLHLVPSAAAEAAEVRGAGW